MATFLGTVSGNRGPASRLGSKSSGIECSAQSWDGSVNLYMRYDRHAEVEDETTLQVRVGISKGSSPYGETVFDGTIAELREALSQYVEQRRRKAEGV